MATTPNFHLPLIESNMTADVPRDMNALAKAVDSAVAEAVVEVHAEIDVLKQSGVSGKALVKSAVNAKGGTVPGSAPHSFNELADGVLSIPVGPDSSDATALAGDIRSGKTAYVKGSKVTGNVPVQSGGNIVPGASDVVKPAGIYDTALTVKGDSNLVPASIKAGVTLFGVAGKTEVVDTTEATNPAASGDILTGKVGFINGTKRTGNMPNKGAPTITPVAAGAALSAGYYSGGGIPAEANFIADKLMDGQSFWGLVGKLKPGFSASGSVTPTSNGTFISDTNGQGVSMAAAVVNTLTFKPKLVVLYSGSNGFWSFYVDPVFPYVLGTLGVALCVYNNWNPLRFRAGGSLYVNNTGFCLPVYNGDNHTYAAMG